MLLQRPLVATRPTNRPWSRFISSSQLTIDRATDDARFANRPRKEDLTFGTTFSDHMLMIEWNKANQWEPPRIVPYGDLRLSPAASSLHYGTNN
jgi:branched-chain amino acid aminotransferase